MNIQTHLEFQFLLVQLKEPYLCAAGKPTIFQFLLVQLKCIIEHIKELLNVISIPSGSIKRTIHLGRRVSMPAFQFLLVQLKVTNKELHLHNFKYFNSFWFN